MLNWTIIFLVLAIVAAFLGFSGIAGTAVGMAKLIFMVSLAIWLLAVIINIFKGKGPKV